jgi:hypothetical protein
VALRGVRASAAISPKISPAFTARISCAPAVRLTRPLSRRYILSLAKSARRLRRSSRKMMRPAGIVSTSPPALKKSSAAAGS